MWNQRPTLHCRAKMQSKGKVQVKKKKCYRNKQRQWENEIGIQKADESCHFRARRIGNGQKQKRRGGEKKREKARKRKGKKERCGEKEREKKNKIEKEKLKKKEKKKQKKKR